jgi:AcrR family transcriptional regulator
VASADGPRAGADADDDAPAVDGRTARRDRNRDRVLDAVIELFTEGEVPVPAAVAARSGVSLRSVYRYVEDTDALARAAIARHLERAAPLLEVDGLTDGDLPERAARLVAARLRFHDEVGATVRAAIARAGANPALADRLAESRGEVRAQVTEAFGSELARLPAPAAQAATAAIDTLLQVEALDHLRTTCRMPARRAQAVLVSAIEALLRPQT